jgi:hypothetical protein
MLTLRLSLAVAAAIKVVDTAVNIVQLLFYELQYSTDIPPIEQIF